MGILKRQALAMESEGYRSLSGEGVEKSEKVDRHALKPRKHRPESPMRRSPVPVDLTDDRLSQIVLSPITGKRVPLSDLLPVAKEQKIP